MKFKQGREPTYGRSFTKENIEGFIDLIHYTGHRHEEENQDGETIVQGLLTTILPTTLREEYDLLVYQILYDPTESIYTRNHIICQARIDQAEEERGKIHYKLGFQRKNQKDQVVLSGYLKAIGLKFD